MAFQASFIKFSSSPSFGEFRRPAPFVVPKVIDGAESNGEVEISFRRNSREIYVVQFYV
jgi:hypothetical protein